MPAKPPQGQQDTNLARLGDDTFDVRSWPFYWIVKTNNQYIQKLETLLKRFELDVPSWRVLMLLNAEKPQSVSFLSREAIVKLSTITRIVRRMEERDLVRTRPKTSDQRVTEVLLTSHGRRARILALQQADEIYSMAFQGMSPEDIELLNSFLEKAFRNMGDSFVGKDQ